PAVFFLGTSGVGSEAHRAAQRRSTSPLADFSGYPQNPQSESPSPAQAIEDQGSQEDQAAEKIGSRAAWRHSSRIERDDLRGTTSVTSGGGQSERRGERVRGYPVPDLASATPAVIRLDTATTPRSARHL